MKLECYGIEQACSEMYIHEKYVKYISMYKNISDIKGNVI